VPRSAVPAELVGRAREIEIVDELLDDIEGDGRPVLFLGEAGIGKSTLLDYAARAGRARGNTVLRADGVEFESDIGYSSLNRALLPIRRHLKALDPAHVHTLGVVLGLRSGDQPDRLVVSTATLHLLRAAAARAPMLFLGDDLQWADPGSQEVFFFLTRRLDEGGQPRGGGADGENPVLGAMHHEGRYVELPQVRTEIGEPGLHAGMHGEGRRADTHDEAGVPGLVAHPVTTEHVHVVEIVQEALEIGIAVLLDGVPEAVEDPPGPPPRDCRVSCGDRAGWRRGERSAECGPTRRRRGNGSPRRYPSKIRRG